MRPKPSVYIETTIPSFYFETRRSAMVVAWREATRHWWDQHRGAYSLFTSKYVLTELSRIPSARAAQTIGLIKEVDLLHPVPEIQRVVETYIQNRLMPADAEGDAAHLAMASMHRIDFVLTWNCRHLANMNKIDHLEVINRRLGLFVPKMTTPLTLLPESDQ
jgi:hypothetical protein